MIFFSDVCLFGYATMNRDAIDLNYFLQITVFRTGKCHNIKERVSIIQFHIYFAAYDFALM